MCVCGGGGGGGGGRGDSSLKRIIKSHSSVHE